MIHTKGHKSRNNDQQEGGHRTQSKGDKLDRKQTHCLITRRILLERISKLNNNLFREMQKSPGTKKESEFDSGKRKRADVSNAGT